MIYKAIHLGAKMKAKKDSGGRWMVGGDYDTNNALIMLPKVCKKTDLISGRVTISERMAWHELRGAVLKFQDWATEEQIEMTIEQWAEDQAEQVGKEAYGYLTIND